ncbi:MAG: fatty acid--CoA ligase family protein [Chitinophagales bacterium]|nr:fatty acid--CoA ligase family protein [Chitinophagales bacterium]
MSIKDMILSNSHLTEDKVFLVDKFGTLTCSALKDSLHASSETLRTFSIDGKKVLIYPKQNDRNLIFSMISLLELGCEIFLAEPKSTAKEIELIMSVYPIEVFMAIDENGSYSIEEYIKKPCEVSDNKPKLYFFSSGTTGVPKVFAYTEDHFIISLFAWYSFLEVKSSDTVLCPLTITHYHGCLMSFGTLLVGATLILTSTDMLNINELRQQLLDFRPSIMTGVPYLYQKIYEHIDEGFEGFSAMKYAICGSAPLMISLSKDFYRKYKIYLNQGYGLSEIGGVSLDKMPTLGLGTVGSIVPQIDYRIIDENGKDASFGELIVKSSYMTEEYYLQPELSKERYIDGWLYSGDIVKLDEHNRLIIIGRKSTFINIQGYKVFPIEIENCIYSFGNIASVLVKGEERGGTITIVAYIECNAAIDIHMLKQYCIKHLASYKIPREIIVTQHLTRTSIGKIKIS